MNVTSRQRRAVMAVAAGELLLRATNAWPLSPPAPPAPTLEDHVADAHLIFVGKIQSFVFRGNDLLILPEEYNKDFSEDNGRGNRAIDAIVRVIRILKNDLDFKIPRVLRMQRPVSSETRSAYLNVEKIFLAQKGFLLNGENAQSRLFRSVTEALPIRLEGEVRKAIAKRGSINQRKRRMP